MRRWLGMVGAAAFLAAAHPVLASIQARAIPSRTTVELRSGEPAARDVAIQNDGDGAVVVRVRLTDWALDPSGELTFLPAGSTTTSLQGLVSFEPTEFSLGPGESGVIHVTIRMPDSGPPTRWGLLLSEVRPASWPASMLGPRAIAELGTTIYATRTASRRAQGELVGMDVRAGGDTTMVLDFQLRNTGERQLYSAGSIALRDSSGHTIAEGDLGTNVVLPGMERRFTWTCKNPPAPGRYLLTATLDTGEPELIVGETEIHWSPGRRPLALHSDPP
jgi:hypothetical protein